MLLAPPISQETAMPNISAPNPRLMEIYDAVLAAFKQVVVDHHVTHQEYCQAVEFLNEVAAARELNLLCDFMLEAAVMEAHFAASQGTVFNAEGPFYFPDAPQLTPPYALQAKGDEVGEPLVFTGSVRDFAGRPVAGAQVEIWHSTPSGLYSNIDPEVPRWDFRGQFPTLGDGSFAVSTIRPCPYEISKQGPVGRMQEAMGRHKYRPAHLHLKIRHPGKQPLTTQIYFKGDPYVTSDAANCVHESLIVPVELVADAALAAKHGVAGAFHHCHYDFVLCPEA